MGGVVSKVSGSMTNWGFGFRGHKVSILFVHSTVDQQVQEYI